MAYQITLTDEEYAALSAAAARTGQTVDELAHAAIAARFAPPEATATDPLVAYMRSKGHLTATATGEGESSEEEAELERVIRSIGPGISLSDMVIEDRGPR